MRRRGWQRLRSLSKFGGLVKHCHRRIGARLCTPFMYTALAALCLAQHFLKPYAKATSLEVAFQFKWGSAKAWLFGFKFMRM